MRCRGLADSNADHRLLLLDLQILFDPRETWIAKRFCVVGGVVVVVVVGGIIEDKVCR